MWIQGLPRCHFSGSHLGDEYTGSSRLPSCSRREGSGGAWRLGGLHSSIIASSEAMFVLLQCLRTVTLNVAWGVGRSDVSMGGMYEGGRRCRIMRGVGVTLTSSCGKSDVRAR